jgi:vacuolar-type H+-ATPase subunit I/STV1
MVYTCVLFKPKNQKMKTTKQLQAIQSKLEALRDELSELIETRQNYFDEKSEKWQESDNGEKYSEDTDGLQNVNDNIDSAFSDLEDLLAND